MTKWNAFDLSASVSLFSCFFQYQQRASIEGSIECVKERMRERERVRKRELEIGSAVSAPLYKERE
jgi:hypothetical protein